MKTPLSAVTTFVVAAAGMLLASGSLQARQPFTEAELAKQKAELLKMTEQGYNLWHGSLPTMQANGLACGNCHPDAAASNPQTFPKFIPSFNRVVTFREMINWCIENPQGGKPLNVNGPEMTAMEAYAFNLHRGVPIEPGLATRQTPSIVVSHGKGFPSKPSGIGQDTKE